MQYVIRENVERDFIEQSKHQTMRKMKTPRFRACKNTCGIKSKEMF